MPRVALHARHSFSLQNPRSVDDQFPVCRQLAEREGWGASAATVMKRFAIPSASRRFAAA